MGEKRVCRAKIMWGKNIHKRVGKIGQKCGVSRVCGVNFLFNL